MGKLGDLDGIGTAAQFYNPNGITLDAAGNIYVADAFKIRKILPSGVVTTFAKMGEFSIKILPGITSTAITFDEKGYLYVASRDNDILFRIDPSGVVTNLAGKDKNAGYVDGIGAVARFFAPCGLTIDPAGNLYVADMGNTVIRKVTPTGLVTTIAGRARKGGYSDGIGATARFDNPKGITADTTGNLYVADLGNYVIRKITNGGAVTTLAGTPGRSGHADGKGAAALFSAPSGIAIDTAGNLYVADRDDSTIRKIMPDGTVTTIAGKAFSRGTEDGPREFARFNYPFDITVNGTGDIYVTDFGNRSIRKIAKNGMVTTFAGRWDSGSMIQDGPRWSASFSHPNSITTDKAGHMYVTDSDSFNGIVRKITLEGQGLVAVTVGGERRIFSIQAGS